MTTDYLLNKELDRVLSALMPTNRLVCEVMLRTGLRVGDVLALRTEALAPVMWVTESKTKKRRQVGLGADLCRRVKEQAGDIWAFPHRSDPQRHRTRQAVWHDVDRAARAFRLPQNVGTHSMRKVYAVELMRKYGDIERVQRALRHSSAQVTALYAIADKLLEAKLKRRATYRGGAAK